MSSWSCPHQVDELCRKVADAYCRPGMKGCVLFGKVTFQDGVVPEPQWPPGREPAARRAQAAAEQAGGEGDPAPRAKR